MDELEDIVDGMCLSDSQLRSLSSNLEIEDSEYMDREDAEIKLWIVSHDSNFLGGNKHNTGSYECEDCGEELVLPA